MVKKFTTNCDFSGTKHPVTFFVGDSFSGVHPLAFQSRWLSKEKGGNVPNEIMDSFSKLKDIADQSKVSFEELCGYVIDELNESKSLASDAKKALEFTKDKSSS
ncbi:MAG: DUF2610 domain-containing protein [Pelagibacterales bacterium]|nr:DUF2610 domain-containing protein [Pelagibacterales bacterium]